MKEDILLFPGWMYDGSLYGDYSFFNLWKKKYTGNDLGQFKYLLGHSMGTLPALLSWQNNPNATVILFNPLLPKRGSLNIFFRFLRMMLTSADNIKAIKESIKLKYLPTAIQNALIFQKIDALKIIQKIPKDKIVIIRGKEDKYFCDLESAAILKRADIRFFELDDVGHFWCPKVDNFIKQFIK